MKTGVIVYATGEPPPGWTEKGVQGVREQLPDADAVEIITRRTGYYDVSEAWFSLTTRGMAQVLCQMAHFNDAGQLHLTKEKLHLCG